MHRLRWAVWLVVPATVAPSGCGALTPCVEEKLELWCFHEEEVPDEVRDAGCDPPTHEPDTLVACGDYEITPSGGPAFSHTTHVFLDGEHVATQYTTDGNTHCGGFEFWYGEKVRCEGDGVGL